MRPNRPPLPLLPAFALLLAACAAPPPAPVAAAPAPVADRPEPAGARQPAAEPLVDRPPVPDPEGPFGTVWESALAGIGLAPDEGRCDPHGLAAYGRGRFRTALYDVLQADARLVDPFARVFRAGALASADRLESHAMFAAGRIDATVRRTLLGDPVAGAERAARAPGALTAVLERAGCSDVPATDALPPEVAAAAALVIRAAVEAAEWRERAFADVDREALARVLEASRGTLVLSAEEDADGERADFERAAGAVDLPYLARGAAEVALAVDRAVDVLTGRSRAGKDETAEAQRSRVAAQAERLAAAGPFTWDCDTPLGRVRLRGDGGDDADTEADAGPWLLRIDLGGDDRYAAGAATDLDHPVSVLIDLRGNDRYAAPLDTPAFGAGMAGYAALVDLHGHDAYSIDGPRSMGLGAGAFGVGMVLDEEGDDAWSADAFAQGAGAVGVGVLADLAGNDRYTGFAYAQGFGFVRGAGVLTDRTGNDRYVAEDTEIRRPSPQSKDHNVSLSQGFGYGMRADYLDGHSLAGGVGLLVDGAGDDRYSCGVFGQGGGYWMGVGMLLEGGGDDAYSGVWYVQGATAHFAVGVLDEAAGDDLYEASMNMAQGAGHDFSIGALIDRAGNDRHVAPNLSLGGGNANGVGIFIDLGGDDAYVSKGNTLGFANVATPVASPSLRHEVLTLGVFLDLGGGDDRYGPDHGYASNGGTWTRESRRRKPKPSNERGVGVDR